ncbi:MAG TPA: glycerol-3-phosphate 1-O-acyltransferase PlsY [Candidatus Margulisiibacteriota bacterium]|nr:glycerol-3-phosphate 1-O-acyltransferase PlsY [Candidatus Margulisiibacteriota bacterium]
MQDVVVVLLLKLEFAVCTPHSRPMWTMLLVIAAYVSGSLPVGVWIGNWVGVDVRRVGSRNIGATNVARTIGRQAGLLTLLGDVAKGVVPTLLARHMMSDPWTIALTGLAAVFGHLFSVFLSFSGGKGVATAFGVFVVLTPAAAALSACLFAVTAFRTGYISLASILSAAALPLITAVCGYPAPSSVMALLVAISIIVRHRDNIIRLRNGVEPRLAIRRGSK